MLTKTVEVEVDIDDVLEDLDDKELATHGLMRVDGPRTGVRAKFDAIRLANLCRDLDGVLDQVEALARDHNVILDLSRVRPSHRAAA